MGGTDSDSDMRKLKQKTRRSNDSTFGGDEKRDPVKKKYKHTERDRSILENSGDLEKKSKKMQQKKNKLHTEDDIKIGENLGKSKAKPSTFDILDDPNTSFLELFSVDSTVNAEVGGENKAHKVRQEAELGGLVIFPPKRRKGENGDACSSLQLQLLPGEEIGVGGMSAWGDD